MYLCKSTTNALKAMENQGMNFRDAQWKYVYNAFEYEMYALHDSTHDDVIKWKHFPRNWPFVREIHRSPVNFPHKGQWRGALMFSLIYAWINDWVNNREAGDLRRQHGHYDVIVMICCFTMTTTVLPQYLYEGYGISSHFKAENDTVISANKSYTTVGIFICTYLLLL